MVLPMLALVVHVAHAAPSPLLEVKQRTLKAQGGARIEAEAGRLMVRENRLNPKSRMIPIDFLRLKSRAKAPRAPLFYLAGGPGSRGIGDSEQAMGFWSGFLEVSDVVLIDQRGVTDSLLTWEWDGPPAVSFFASADSALAHEAEMNRRAATAVRARGVDLAGYNTDESAADLDELRAALGLERISLLGFSYGTHLGCAYMRKYGDRIESSLLLGLEGPDHTYKLPWTMDTQLQRLALLAAQDPRISGKVPDLIALYDRVIAKLAREPMVVSISGPGGQGTYRIPVGPFGLRFLMRFDVGDASDLVVFPRLLWSIDQGDPSVLTWFVEKRAGLTLGVHGMNAAVDAASGVSRGRLALIEEQKKTSRFADVVNFPYEVSVDAWAVPDLGAAFRSPLVSSVRTLLVSGSLDFNTPPHQAEELRWGLTNATHLIVENAGHEQTLFQNDTALPVILDFLAGKDVHAREITYPPLRFVPLEGSDPAASHPSVRK